MPDRRFVICSFFLSLLSLSACRDRNSDNAKPVKQAVPVTSLPVSGTNGWDAGAGSLMLVSLGDNLDSAAVVFPEVADSGAVGTRSENAVVSGVVFDLFDRSGKIASSTAALLLRTASDTGRNCTAWPIAKLDRGQAGWRVAFIAGRVKAISLDSIEGLASTDSAALAASLAKSAATLPTSSDPIFRQLPFRVRFAYRAHLDSTEIVIADVVRALNEEANPRIEDLFLIGDRPVGSLGGYVVRYYNRTAGPEETMQATEVLAAVKIVSSKRVSIVASVESEEGSRLQLLEPTELGVWHPAWISAYTRCSDP
jgi:hypothetical protein